MERIRSFCCFCDLTLLGWDLLAQHLIDKHAREVVCGRSLIWPTRRSWDQPRVRPNDMICWCGAECSDNWTFGQHLEIHGGLEQHLLAIAIGVMDNHDPKEGGTQ